MAHAFLPIPGVGDATTAGAVNQFAPSNMGWLNMVGAGLATYHGYKRNQSIAWALVWGAFGAFAPIITNAIGVAQGFSKPKGAP